MFNKLFPAIECEDSDAVMDFAGFLFFTGLLTCLVSVPLFLVVIYVL